MLIREEALSRRFHGNSNSNDKLLFDPDAQPEKQFRVDKGMVDFIKIAVRIFMKMFVTILSTFWLPLEGFGSIWQKYKVGIIDFANLEIIIKRFRWSSFLRRNCRLFWIVV